MPMGDSKLRIHVHEDILGRLLAQHQPLSLRRNLPKPMHHPQVEVEV